MVQATHIFCLDSARTSWLFFLVLLQPIPQHSRQNDPAKIKTCWVSTQPRTLLWLPTWCRVKPGPYQVLQGKADFAPALPHSGEMNLYSPLIHEIVLSSLGLMESNLQMCIKVSDDLICPIKLDECKQIRDWIKVHLIEGSYWLTVSPPNPYVQALTHNVMVSWDKTFGK